MSVADDDFRRMSDVKALAEPILYQRPAGSVQWVKLTPENGPNRYRELEPSEVPAEPPKVEVTIYCPQPQPSEVKV